MYSEDMQHESSDDFWHASDDIEYQRLRKKKKEDLADPAKEWSDLDQLRYLSLRAKKQMYRAAQAPAEKMAAPSEGTTKAHGSVGTLEVKMTPPEEVLTAPVEESTATPTKDMPGEADEPSSHTENTVEQPDPVIENQVATDQTPAEAEVAMPALRSSKAQQKKRNREILRRARAEAEKKANMDEEEGTGEANTFIRYEADELRSLGGDTSLEVRYKVSCLLSKTELRLTGHRTPKLGLELTWSRHMMFLSSRMGCVLRNLASQTLRPRNPFLSMTSLHRQFRCRSLSVMIWL